MREPADSQMPAFGWLYGRSVLIGVLVHPGPCRQRTASPQGPAPQRLRGGGGLGTPHCARRRGRAGRQDAHRQAVPDAEIVAEHFVPSRIRRVERERRVAGFGQIVSLPTLCSDVVYLGSRLH